FPLLRAHAFKVTIVLALQTVALVVFAALGKVMWGVGLLLAAGLATGGYIGARIALRSGERVLRVLLVVASAALALKLLFG
ncbi:MAG: TSUP family transporter, partial [Acidobacteriota bacterium]|nr:TSUP family transporter [Acidobacteriota bacterium]